MLPALDLESTVRAGHDVGLHAVAAGDPDDPLVVLLHGFPEFWYGWRNQIEPLVEAGFRVLVPDQRGYNLSEKPGRVWDYRIEALSRDVVELIRGEDRESAHVVGHDWGGAVAWDLALRYPDAVDRLGICNVPHPSVFRRHLRSNWKQLRKSWYAFYFQLPWLPELGCRRGNYAALEKAMRGRAAPGSFTDRDLDRYREAWSKSGALTAMLNWYRAAVRHRTTPPREIVAQPTAVIWGEEDVALEADMAPESLAYCEDGRLERFPGASHWVPHDRAEAVTALLVEHLSAE